MKKKISGAVSLVLVAAMLLSACSAGSSTKAANASSAAQPVKVTDVQDQYFEATDPSKSPENANQRTDTFVANISEPGGVFVPYFYDNGWDENAIQPIFARLVAFDNGGDAVADLADKWEISKDGLQYTFHIREGAKFSDGTPVTAEDVAFTLTLLDDPNYTSGVIDISTAYIKGADAYKNGNAESISGIKVVDTNTVQITTEQSNPLNLFMLGGYVLPKAYYGKDYKKGQLDYLKNFYSKPMGAGPYAFDEYVNGQEVRYTANPNYYGGKPKIEHLIFKVTSKATALQTFQAGETDFDGFTPDQDTLEQLQSLEFANINVRTVPDYGYIYMNNKKAYLKDTKVRQALSYGLDRQKVIDVKYKGYGQVANVYTDPLLWSYTEEGITKYDFNPDKAKQLLDEAGWKAGSDGIRVKDGQRLKLSYLTSKADDAVIPIAKEDYTNLGIEFVPEVLDANTMFSRLNASDYDLLAVRTSVLMDPNDSVAEFASDKPNLNVAGYSNPKVDELIQQGVSTMDEATRKETYKKLYQELSNDPPVILLDYRKSIAAWNARIEGAKDYSTGDYDSAISLSKLSIKK